MGIPIRREVMPVPKLEMTMPSEKQKLFLMADKKYIAFGGA